ncbi:uncharacterized protein PFL1_00264 [Pseudozyma flocculosa PF-1]|uniref:uncharacterized protein n=1 Tax=Pseudozyma flocculosa PF-1 TaxID=1277687 RepID=UPI000456043C|nr:uncharacterized protein PFL1_00264 [Pseudozyma flocculosa PF-1]EPQ32066.1 hypothetical protein PFL1_00264 [Pseudozyma flocculosa PF-1]
MPPVRRPLENRRAGPTVVTSDNGVRIIPRRDCSFCAEHGLACEMNLVTIRNLTRVSCDSCRAHHNICPAQGAFRKAKAPKIGEIRRCLKRIDQERVADSDFNDDDDVVEVLDDAGAQKGGTRPAARRAAKRAKTAISSAYAELSPLLQSSSAAARAPASQERRDARSCFTEVEVVVPRSGQGSRARPRASSSGAGRRFETLLVDATELISDLIQLVEGKGDDEYKRKYKMYKHGLDAIDARLRVEAAHLGVELPTSQT